MASTKLKRIGISIPDSTLMELKQLVPERKRSKYIAKAIEEKLKLEKREKLQEEMIKGYTENQNIDIALAEEWFHIEEEGASLKENGESKDKTLRRKTK